MSAVAPPLDHADGKFTTAGIIIIGDEILKGQTQDTNSGFIARRLFAIGVRVKRISVIADDVNIIAREVAEFSKTFTHVLTSGGIGPTHDDLTLEGVARAFNEPLVPHPDIVQLCKKYFGTDDLRSPKLKLAFVPHSAELCYGTDKITGSPGKFPVVKVRNVFIFPGIPKLLTTAFDRLENIFRNPDAEFVTREVYISVDEASITGILNAANNKFKDHVILGSYPELHNSYYKVKLSLEATERTDLDAMCAYLADNLPANSIVDYDKDPIVQAASRVYALAEPGSGNEQLLGKVSKAVSVIEQSYSKYSPNEICVGFNGGKDCTALLHLAHAVVMRSCTAAAQPQTRLTALYVRHGQAFPEMELFVNKCKEAYNLDLITITAPLKEALQELKTLRPQLKAVLMGTRLSDPYSTSLEDFSPTDDSWPQYMRVNPLLSWTYKDVWAFIRKLCLPYCSLYDRGYTSLGSMENTHPNPVLRLVDGRGTISYHPAYKLEDDQLERAGRNV